MATNFRHYYNRDVRPAKLHVDDINVGDELVRADWSYAPAKWVETIWTVTKVLKNRLVLSRDVKRGDEIVTITTRVLVHNSKSRPYDNGKVQARVEGQSEWNRDAFYLFTPDEPLLAEMRDKLRAASAKQQARNNAVSASKKITDNPRHFTAEDAAAAIAALQTFIDSPPE